VGTNAVQLEGTAEVAAITVEDGGMAVRALD